MFMRDLKARARKMDRGAIVERGTHISMVAWRSAVNTFEECFFTSVEKWVHLYGLP